MKVDKKSISFYPIGETKKFSRNYVLIYNEDEEIGGVEGFVNVLGELWTVIKINPEYQNQGIGKFAFIKLFHELLEEIKINSIIGNWLMDEEEFGYCEGAKSTNLNFFWDCINQKKSEKECIFLTPTGKWAKELGFKNFKIRNKSDKTVTVEFH